MVAVMCPPPSLLLTVQASADRSTIWRGGTVGDDIYTAPVVDTDVLLIDLAVELDDALHALPYVEYRRQLHEMLSELLAFHRHALPDCTARLADQTLGVLAPGASPSDAGIASITEQWDSAFAESTHPDRCGSDRNAYSLSFTLRYVGLELTSSPYVMAIYVASALTARQLRPATPQQGSTDRLETVADFTSVEVRMLARFIAAAKEASVR